MNRTKKAIIDTFLQLLEEKPYNKITVNDIVESCHINRNTFYYHFHDIPTLLEDIIKSDTDYIIQTYNSFGSPLDCFAPLVELCVLHKKAILHIYHSVESEVFLKELNRLCHYAITQYIDATTAEIPLLPEDKELLIRFYKCALVGILLDWLGEGMRYDLLASFSRICELFDGSDQQALLRAASPKK